MEIVHLWEICFSLILFYFFFHQDLELSLYHQVATVLATLYLLVPRASYNEATYNATYHTQGTRTVNHPWTLLYIDVYSIINLWDYMYQLHTPGFKNVITSSTNSMLRILAHLYSHWEAGISRYASSVRVALETRTRSTYIHIEAYSYTSRSLLVSCVPSHETSSLPYPPSMF